MKSPEERREFDIHLGLIIPDRRKLEKGTKEYDEALKSIIK
jgi:hypothetical protein